MFFYWIRKRFIATMLVCCVLAAISVLLFVIPAIKKQAEIYNSQSVYKNSKIDFIVPEPSFDQVSELPGTNGIDKVFPYFLTKTQVEVNGTSRTSTVLLSDQFDNIGFTMYNPDRLIAKSKTEYDNPIYIDWQFSHDTSAGIGDTVSISVAGNKMDFIVSAIYETNSIFDGGAILAKINQTQKEIIINQSKNNGYSGMYVSASDYGTCQSYLKSEYRPLGRLKDRSQFESDEQYNLHYDAIMSSGFANEITDFRVQANSLNTKGSSMMAIIGAALFGLALLIYNIVMLSRGCEKNYFAKNCIPKGQNIRPYYNIECIFEFVFGIAFYVAAVILGFKLASDYIPKSAIGLQIVIVPAFIICAVLANLIINHAVATAIIGKSKKG